MTTKFIGLKDFRQNLAGYTKAAKSKNIRFIILKKNVPVLEVKSLDEKAFTLEKLAAEITIARAQVKKGETYYDPSTRVGSSQRFAQRKKVGPKIVGPKLSAAQDFDKAYGSAKEKGGVGSTFNWRGKSYKVS